MENTATTGNGIDTTTDTSTLSYTIGLGRRAVSMLLRASTTSSPTSPTLSHSQNTSAGASQNVNVFTVDPTSNSTASELDADMDTDAGNLDAVGMAHEPVDDDYTNEDEEADEDDGDHDDDDDDDDHDLDNDDDLELSQDEDLDYGSNSDSEHQGLSENEIGGPSEQEIRVDKIHTFPVHPSEYPHNIGESKSQNYLDQPKPADALSNQPKSPNSLASAKSHIGRMFTSGRSTSNSNNELSANSRPSVAGSAEQLSRIRSKSSLDRRRDSLEPQSTISASTSDVGRRRAPSIHIDSPSVEDSLGLVKKSLPHMVAASATVTGNDASSVNSINSSTDASDTSIKRRQTYFQKLGIFRASKTGNDKLTPTGSVTSKTGFVLNRRHSSSKLKPSEDMLDDESSNSAIGTGGTSAFRKSPRNKAIKAGFIPISTKNKSYTELSRLKKVQLLPAGNPSTFTHFSQVASAAISVASSGGGAGNREKAFSLHGSEIETPHIPVSGAILTMRFCQGGRYLATGGADCILRVFVVSAFGGANATDSIRSDPAPSEISNSTFEPLRNMSNPTPFNQTRTIRPQQAQQQQKPTADSISLRSFKQSPLEHQQPSRADSFRHTSAPATSANSPEKLSAAATTFVHPRQVLNPTAYRTFAGHTLPIQDLCWSRSNFLLSASSDKTVRLWHVQKASCLKVFAHDAVVSCVRFHPIDEGCFVSVTAGSHATSAFVGGQMANSGSGSASGHGAVPGTTAGASGARSRLRVWSIGEKRVLHFVDLASQGGTSGGSGDSTAGPASATGVGGAPVPAAGGGSGTPGAVGNTSGSGFVTALEFSKDGSLVITGTVDGGLYFHDFLDENSLVYNTHVDLKPQGNIKHFRVTGVECLGGAAAAGAAMYDDGSSAGPGDDGIAGGEGYVLVTASDGRIRLFNLRDKSLVRRYRGPDMRTFGGVKAVGSIDGRFAICGSEKGTVHIWDLDPNSFANRGVVADMLAAAGDFDDKKRASFVASGAGGGDSAGANAPAGNAGTGGGGKNRFFSGLMQWQTDQGRYGESFRAADYSVLCAAFAPPNVRSILGLDISTGVANTNLTGAFIAAADVVGNIHIFENEPPPSGSSRVQDLHMVQAGEDHQLAVPLGKRSFSSPANSGSNASLHAEQSRKSFVHSPVSPTLESLHIELVGRNLSATAPGGQVDPFSSGVSFLPKISLKSAAPSKDQVPQPQFVISPAANSSFEFEDCGVPLTNTQLSSPRQSRRRSYSSASSYNNIHNGSASVVTPWQEPPVSLGAKDGAEPSPFKSASKLSAVGSGAAISTPQSKPSLMESWMHLRAHAKSVSVNKSALLDGAASSNNTAPANATPASKLGGIFHRKRGATTADSSGIGAHARSITTPASTAFSANNGAAHPPSRLFQATLALVAMNEASSDQSTPPLTPAATPPAPRVSGRKSGNDLRRNGISLTDLSLNRESLSSDGRPVSKQPSASSLRSSASNRIATIESFADELDKEETLETCPFCGGLQFSLTKGKKLVCIKCRKRREL
ncbi:WD repeat-containing protein 44 [Chytriomyces hyalinus]|nr:WD repeat-containing protein 44 [Chytriomyces hyalinus]